MNNDAGWNGSGGPWVKPEHAMQKVVWTETASRDRGISTEHLPQPQTVGGYYEDIAVLAFPTPPADGDPKTRYRIDHLAGKTALVREAMTPRAEYPAVPADAIVARDGIVDLTAKLDKQGQARLGRARRQMDRAADRPHADRRGQRARRQNRARVWSATSSAARRSTQHWAGLMGKLIADVGPEAGKTLTYTHIDSWENGSQNWTPKMREEFQRRRGYDMLPWLPVMTGRVVDSLEAVGAVPLGPAERRFRS